MSDAVLRAPRWKTTGLAFVGALFAVPQTLAVLGAYESAGKSLFACTSVAVCCLGAAYFAAGTRLRIRADGLEVKKPFSAPTYVHWDDVEEIGLATVPNWTKGREGYQYYVGFRLSGRSRRHGTQECTANRKLCGYDVLLADSYGMSLDPFITFLRDQKANARKG